MSRFMFTEFILNQDDRISSCADYLDRLFALLSNIPFDFSIVHGKKKLFHLLKDVETSESLHNSETDKDMRELFSEQMKTKDKFIKFVIDDDNELNNKIAWSITVILFNSFSLKNMKSCFILFKDMLRNDHSNEGFKTCLNSLDCLVFPECFSRFDFRIKQTLNFFHLVFLNQSYRAVSEAITLLEKDPNWNLA